MLSTSWWAVMDLAEEWRGWHCYFLRFRFLWWERHLDYRSRITSNRPTYFSRIANEPDRLRFLLRPERITIRWEGACKSQEGVWLTFQQRSSSTEEDLHLTAAKLRKPPDSMNKTCWRVCHEVLAHDWRMGSAYKWWHGQSIWVDVMPSLLCKSASWERQQNNTDGGSNRGSCTNPEPWSTEWAHLYCTASADWFWCIHVSVI